MALARTISIKSMKYIALNKNGALYVEWLITILLTTPHTYKKLKQMYKATIVTKLVITRKAIRSPSDPQTNMPGPIKDTPLYNPQHIGKTPLFH